MQEGEQGMRVVAAAAGDKRDTTPVAIVGHWISGGLSDGS